MAFTEAATGIQGFWNYDVFSLLGPMSARPQSEAMGFVNTWNFNLCFTQTDILTQFHNNPPFITRAYNSMVDGGDPNFRGGVSLVGKDWMLNYEHCLIEVYDVYANVEKVYEIDPTRCVNEWDCNGPYIPPAGVFKEMVREADNGAFYYEITTKDYFVFHFIENQNITFDPDTNNKFYVLEYIEDRNGVRVYVDWEDMSATAFDDRIKAIQVSLDEGTTKYDVIRFEYDAAEPGLISRYSLVAIDSLPSGTTTPNWFADMHWDFTYDGSGNLIKVEYPIGSNGRSSYSYAYDTNEFEVTDMEGTKHSYYSPSANNWYREIWAKDGVAYYARISYASDGSGATTITDPETDEDWIFTHEDSDSELDGRLLQVDSPKDNGSPIFSYIYTWTANNQLADITSPDIQSIVAGVPDTITSKVSFSYNGDFNLIKVEWSQDGGDPIDRYTTQYTYGSGISKNDLTKVEMHEDYADSNFFTETQFEYDTNHNVTLIRAGINPNVTDPTDPEDMSVAAVTLFTYTDEGSLDSITMPEGNKIGFCYNSDISKGALGSLAKIKEYLSDGIPTTVLTTYLEYYFLELRLKSITTSGKTPTTMFSYSNIGELKLISISEGETYDSRYDRMGNPIELTGPNGTTTIDYDLKTTPLNLPCTIIEPSPNNDENKKTAAYLKNGLVNTTSFMYYQDEYETTYNYDIANRLTSVVSEVVSDGPTETVSFAYDDCSNVITIADPGGNVSSLFYNLVGNIIMACAPEDDGSATPTRWERVEFTYGGPMGLPSVTWFKYGPSGSIYDTHTFFYDRLGRLVRWVRPVVGYPHGPSPTHTYTYSDLFYYDRNSNTIMVVNREYETSSGDPVTTDTNSYYTYDGFNRLVKACIEYEDEHVLDMGWSYDIYGNLLESTEGGMRTVRMAYDDKGKLTGVYKPSQHSNQGATYEYDATSGKMTKKSVPGGMASEMVYGPDGSQQSTISGPVQQTNDECGDKTGSAATAVIPGDSSPIDIGEEAKSTKTEYYENGWLKRVILPNGDYIGYSYDGLGRIITVYESVPEQDPAADDSNWPFGSVDNTAITLNIEYNWSYTGHVGTLSVIYTTYKSGGDYETKYFFNEQGRLGEVEFYVGNIQGGGDGWHYYNYTYDGRGNLTHVAYDGGGALITNTYNHLDQLVTQAYGNLINSYRHSPFLTPALTQSYSSGNETHFRDITLTFDKVLRLLKEEDTDNILTDDDPDPVYTQVTKLFEFHHDSASRIIRIKDPYYDSVENDPMQTRVSIEENNYLGTIERTDTNNPVRGHAETYNHFFDEAGRLRKVDLPDITATEGTPGDEGANQASVTVEYDYDASGKLSSVTVTSIREDSQIYHIAYAYDDLGRMTERIVREDSSDVGWLNWSTFKYDGRNQLLDEKYTYSSDGSAITLVYQATNAYDLGGNLTSRVLKRLEPPASPPPDFVLVTYTFSSITYSQGYQLLDFDVSDGVTTWGYSFLYDSRGNHLDYTTSVSDPAPPFTFPSFTYDSLNNVESYTAGGSTWTLWRDPMGRVFRKADTNDVTPTNATHYYYTFNALAQEYDEHPISEVPEDDFEFDYLRRFNGHVLRQRDVEDADPDRQPLHDLQGSPLNLINADDAVMSADTSGYTFDAWGESFAAGDGDGQPSETNHLRYHGAFAEDFLTPADDTDGLYRMGARHYSTVLGRFLQREPLTLISPPSPASPISANPYLYSHNSPTCMTDISGLQTMNAGSTYNVGPLYPPEKPEVQPYEPPGDVDPGFTPPEGVGPKTVSFQIPGFNPFPWWDRRQMPDICMGLWTPGNTLGPAKPPPEVTERQEEIARIGAELLSKAFRGLLPVLYLGSGGSRYICTGRGSSGGGANTFRDEFNRNFTGGWGIAEDNSLIVPGINVGATTPGKKPFSMFKDIADFYYDNLGLQRTGEQSAEDWEAVAWTNHPYYREIEAAGAWGRSMFEVGLWVMPFAGTIRTTTQIYRAAMVAAERSLGRKYFLYLVRSGRCDIIALAVERQLIKRGITSGVIRTVNIRLRLPSIRFGPLPLTGDYGAHSYVQVGRHVLDPMMSRSPMDIVQYWRLISKFNNYWRFK